MFTTFLETLQGYLGRGFLLAVFVPTLIFAGVNLTMGLEVSIGLDRFWQRWIALPTESQVLLLLAGLIGLAFSAFVIHNLQLSITRFFEGYWRKTPLWWLYERRRTYYQREWCYLQAEVQRLDQQLQAKKSTTDVCQEKANPDALQAVLSEKLERWSTMFSPTVEGYRRIQPTRLGNVLRASELYARDHYGIDAVTLWTRFHPLLPASTLDILQNKKIALDFMLLMAAYAGLFTLIWCPILAYVTNRWLLFLACAAGLPLAWIGYYTAVQSALAYGEQIRSVFDLHRYELLKALGLKIPIDLDEERALWQEVSLFFQRNIPPAAPYQLAINPDEAWKYTQAPEPLAKPKGWAHIHQALHELWQGIKEIL